jgi:hypothetical protein
MEGWDPRLVHALTPHHRVVMFDNSGVGHTQELPQPFSVDAMADQTSALIAAGDSKSGDGTGHLPRVRCRSGRDGRVVWDVSGQIITLRGQVRRRSRDLGQRTIVSLPDLPGPSLPVAP